MEEILSANSVISAGKQFIFTSSNSCKAFCLVGFIFSDLKIKKPVFS